MEVNFVGGKPAVLSIYADGELREEVNLFEIDDLEQLQKMMVDKGFELMSEEEIAAMKEIKNQEMIAENARKLADRDQRRAASEARRVAKDADAAAAAAVAQEEATAEKVSAGEL